MSLDAVAIAEHVYRSSSDFAAERQTILATRLIGIITRAADMDLDTTLDVICAAADGLGAGHPMLGARHDEWAADAAAWAGRANPHELEAYITAALAALPNRAVAVAARKRAIVAIWNSLDDRDRAAFLDFVDPQGAGKE
jgi:hypothetical protein